MYEKRSRVLRPDLTFQYWPSDVALHILDLSILQIATRFKIYGSEKREILNQGHCEEKLTQPIFRVNPPR